MVQKGKAVLNETKFFDNFSYNKGKNNPEKIKNKNCVATIVVNEYSSIILIRIAALVKKKAHRFLYFS